MKVNEILEVLSKEGVKDSEVGLAYVGTPMPFSEFLKAILSNGYNNADANADEFVSGFVCFCFSNKTLTIRDYNFAREIKSKNKYLYLIYVDK